MFAAGVRGVAVTAAVASAAAVTLGAPAHAAPRAAAADTSVSPFSAGTWGGTGTSMQRVRASIKADTETAKKYTGAGIGIALIDTGVVPVAGLPSARVVNGPDLSLESQSAGLRYLDTYGHGTHLAGIIAGNDPATGFQGVAPGAQLTSIKVGTATGAVDPTQVIAALDWVVAHRNDDPANPIRVVNLSYGVPNKVVAGKDALYKALDNAVVAGILVVTSAGNLGSGVTAITSPATGIRALTVGSVGTNGTDSPTDDKLSSFSATKSAVTSNRQSVDVVAPGESIVSLRNPGSYADSSFPSAREGETFFRGSGTSQAAAVVSGAAAVLLQKNPKMDPMNVVGMLRDTATVVNGQREINLDAALKRSPSSITTQINYQYTTGAMNDTRGSVRLTDGSTTLDGDRSITGTFSMATWATASTKGTAWQGGVWMGLRLAGDGWTGTSWASKTWAPATWSGTNWAGNAWADGSWSGRAWSGRAWSAGSWEGRYWSSDAWSSDTWG